MDEPLEQKVPSKIYGSSRTSEEMNAVSHQKLQESKEEKRIAWPLFESQITNGDSCCVLGNVPFALATASST